MATEQEYGQILAKNFTDKSAKILSLRFNRILGQRELVLFYPLDAPSKTQISVEALNLYGCLKNFPNKRLWIDKPLSDRTEEYPGIWRVIENRGAKHSEAEGVYQTLREGWATTLDDGEARISNAIGTPTLAGYSFTRYYPNIANDSLEALAKTLNSTETVTNPKVMGKTVTGVFAVSQVQSAIMEGDGAGVVSQILTLTAANVAAQKPRIRDITGNYTEGTLSFTRFWPDIILTALHTEVVDRKAIASVTNPQIEGQTYTGTFAISGVRGDRAENGTGVVSEILTQVVAMTASTSTDIGIALAAKKYLKTRDNEILQLFDFATGEGDALALVFPGIAIADETKCMDTVTDAQLVTSLASGWTYSDRHWKVESSGVATFVVAFKKATWRAWTTASYSGTPAVFDNTTADVIDYGDPARDGEQVRKTWLAIAKADLDAAVADLSAEANAGTGYHVVRVDVANKGNGSFDISQSLVKIISQSAATGNISDTRLITPHDFQTGTQYKLTSVYRHFTVTELTALSETTPTNYTLVASPTDIEEGSGLFSRTYEYERNVFRAWSATTATADVTEDTKYGRGGSTRTRVWLAVAKGDASTGVTELQADTGTYAPGTGFHVVDVRIQNNRNGSVDLVQVSVKQIAETAATGTLAESEVINPHGLQSGTMNRKRSVYSGYTTTELAAISDSAPSGYTLVDTKTELDGQTGYYMRQYIYELPAWRAWSGAAATTTEYDNAGTANERERITRTWEGIQKADLSTAVAACRTGAAPAAPESGYIVTDVGVRDAGNGSVTIRQAQKKQVNGIDVTGMKLISPHALKQGVATTITTRYDGFTEVALPNPSGKVPGTDTGVISNEVEGPGGDGLFSRVIVEETVTWYAWATYSATPDITEYDNQGTQKESKHRQWLGIQSSDRATATTALMTPESGYVVSTIRVSDNRNGACTITQTQTKKTIGTSGAPVENIDTTLMKPHDFNPGTLNRITIINENLATPTEAYATPSTSSGYALVDTRRRHEGDGRWSVYYIYEKVTWTAWASAAPDVVHDSFPHGIVNNVAPITVKTRTWFNVPKADIVAAMSALWTTLKDAGFYVEDVTPRNNGDGSFDLVQVEIKVDTSTEIKWLMANGTYVRIYKWDGVVTSRIIMDRMFYYTRKYFISEEAALAWLQTYPPSAHSGSGVKGVSPYAWVATKITRSDTDRVHALQPAEE